MIIGEKVPPVHPAAVGDTIYVAVPELDELFVRVWFIEVPLPAVPPLTLVCVGAPHTKLVPATVELSVTEEV